MNKYKAFYKGFKSIDIDANTSYEAQKIAAGKFKAKKSYEVTVVLLSLGETPVIHSTSSI